MKNDMQLIETSIIRMLREEYTRKLNALAEKSAAKLTKQAKVVDNAAETVVSTGLKLRRKSDNTLMTVNKTGSNFVQLKTPAGELYKIMIADLDKDFELD